MPGPSTLGLSLCDPQPGMTRMKTSVLNLALSTTTAALGLGVAPAAADIALPAPYVSRALDAVLLPIDEDVRATFGLAGDDEGVLVLATEPGGVADAADIVPGDVIHMIGGQEVASPIEVDEIVLYWILEGIVDFDLGVYRDGGYVEVISTISEEIYWEVIEITTIETWSSWEMETSFSYEEFYAEYAEEMIESYEYSEAVIEETVTSEDFGAEMSEEVYEEEYGETSEEEFDEEVSEDETEEESADEEEDFDEAESEGYDEDEEGYDELEEESGDEGDDEGGDEDEG